MKKIILCILFIICSIFNIQAEFSLEHKTGAYPELQDNGMQKTHTDYQIMYAAPGETVYLYRPERSTFVSYVRWYCYDTDRAIPSWYSAEDSPTGIAIPRIESTWAADTTSKIRKNSFGWFACDYASDRVVDSTKTYIEIKYTMHNGDSIYRIACDQGIWKDYSPTKWNNNSAMAEPTLSKRIIFEIRPAKWMADSLELCKSMIETYEDNYLEEHKLIAPTNRQLYIGPNHPYRCAGTKIKLTQYSYFSRSNYHHYDSNHNITIPNNDANWKWYKNGIEDTDITLQPNSSQFVPVYNSTTDTIIYTLKYYSSTDRYYFNVARFKVIYKDKNIVGPVEEISNIPHKVDKIYEQTFNFDKPNTMNCVFWHGHLDVDESTYGYYDINLDETPETSQRRIRQGNITWSEYAITNTKAMWADGSDQIYYLHQHVDGIKNNSSSQQDNNAKEGYMIYCDGSQQPGLVFNLKVNTDLCPGSTMYFSAWIADASSKRVKNPDRSAPNMDFEVIGIDNLGKEHVLTTFTTGEFGVNAVEDRSKGAWDKNKKSNWMDRGIWYQIMFPVKFTAETTYPTYRLRITNKSTSSDGNDFAIDDIRIYVEKPPVMPIQASTSDCINKAVDSIRSYIRVDYNEIDHDGQPLYYQWREGDKIIHTDYYNIDGPNDTFGKINILPDANITASDTCSDLFSFDNQFNRTDSAVVRYIWEEVEPGVSRYIMYIAMPLEVRINKEYTSFVSLSTSTLGDRTGCGTFADMLVAGGTRITINDEITFGDSVVTVCGHRTYTLNIVLTKIIQDETQGELRIDTTHCKADWLIGDSIYVNSHPEIYKYSFNEIETYLKFYRQQHTPPAATQMVNFLKNHGLLVLDTASIVMNPGISLSYTAFPLEGSASDDSIEVCTTPRFLHINPAEPASNMMEVGDSTEVLPEELLSQPRIVRISNAKKNEGNFDLPLYLKGDTTERYIIDSVHMISSTNPNWFPIRLSADHPIMAAKDTVSLSSDSLPLLEAGYDYTFHVAFKGESDEDKCDRGYTYFTLRIIPDVVTWYGGKWNVDANWDYFIPMKETNVILLNDSDYIVSFDDKSLAKFDINYIENQCDSIYFPDGASMYGQEKIIINGIAFIDIKEYAWKWTLSSIPIQGVVTGDLFVSAHESTEPFVVAPINQTVGTYAEDRVKWQLYHKEYDAEKDKWKVATNTTTRLFVAGDANMIGIDCETNDIDPIIRLPKQDNMYRYYEKNQLFWLQECEYIERIENYGKPIWNGDTIFKLKQVFENIYLLGNPTFGYINISELVDDNSDKLTGRYYLEAEGAEKIPKKIEMIEFNHTIDDGENAILLPPYRGILLEAKSASDSLIINIDSTKVNPTGRQAPKRYRYTNNDIATDVQNINMNNVKTVYDVFGRLCTNNLNQLPEGIYIICSENKTYKMYLKR